jgi:fructosamine-3-kinase
VSAGLPAEVARVAGCPVSGWREVPGGDVNRAARARLGDGREVFVKHRPGAPVEMYEAEARGLRWLTDAGSLRCPEVVGVGRDPPCLVLGWIAPGRPGPGHDETLGRGLAALHRAGAPGFGARRPGFIGPIPWANEPLADWPAFLAERRLLPLTRAAVDAGGLDASDAARMERLCARLPGLCGPPEPPARLHGDLWSGNVIVSAQGQPVLIDPAPYGGHREVDLAMMRLFGGFGPRVFAAYSEVWPLAPGHRDRVGLNQLVPRLVHVILVGPAYAGGVRSTLARLVGDARHPA